MNFLVLSMRTFSTLMIISILAACSNEKTLEENAVLANPPYDKLTDSIQQIDKNADLYYKRGTLLYKNEEIALAEKDLRKAWELDANEKHALGVSTLLKNKNQDEAVRFLEEALKKLPNSLFIQLQLAQGYKYKGQMNRSLELCEQILASYPNNIDVYLLKAELLKSQNKNPEAIAALEKAYQLAPGDVELVHTLGFDYAETKNPKVLSLSDSLIRVDTEKSHAEPYYFKGLYYENTGKYNDAIKYYDEAIRHNFNFQDAYMSKGSVYFDQKKYTEALKIFELATQVFPTEGNPYFWLGKTQEAMGNTNEARLNYQRAYGLDKTLTEAKEAADRLK